MATGTAARFISMARAPDEAAATRKAPVRTVMMLGAEKQSLVTNPFHHGPAVAPVKSRDPLATRWRLMVRLAV